MRRMIVAALLIFAFAAAAAAHALLKSAVPAVGAEVAPGPRELRLTFSEEVEMRFSGVDVREDGERAAVAARAALDPADARVVVVTLAAPLPPGRYRVHWHVVSVDTHRTEGDYGFQVK